MSNLPPGGEVPIRLDVRALAIATGSTVAGAVLVTTWLLVLAPGDFAAPAPARAVLFGYAVTPAGAVIGGLWGYAYGFVVGAVLAFVYNLAAAPAWPPESPPPGKAPEESG